MKQHRHTSMHSSRKKHSADCARQCFGSGLNPDSNGSVGIRIRNKEHKNDPQKTHALKSWIFSLKSWRLLLELCKSFTEACEEIMYVANFFFKQTPIFFCLISVIKILDPDPGKDPNLDSKSLDPNQSSKNRKARII